MPAISDMDGIGRWIRCCLTVRATPFLRRAERYYVHWAGGMP